MIVLVLAAADALIGLGRALALFRRTAAPNVGGAANLARMMR